MPVFKGRGSGDIYSQYFNIPYKIISFYITNRDASYNATVSVYIQTEGGRDTLISAKSFTLKPGQSYVRDTITKVAKNERIHIVTNILEGRDLIDYYFSID